LLISLLIVASVLVDLAALEFSKTHRDLPAITAHLGSLAVSQVALVSLWAGLARTWVYLRMTIAVGICWSWGWLLGNSGHLRDHVSLLLAAMSSAVILGAWFWRECGMRVVDSYDVAIPSESLCVPPPRFRIADIFRLTFLLAMPLAMIRPFVEARHEFLLSVLLPAPLVAAFVLLFMWLTLRCGQLYYLHIIAVGLFSVLLGLVGAVLASATLLLVGSLLVVRIAGYRLVSADRSVGLVAANSATASA